MSKLENSLHGIFFQITTITNKENLVTFRPRKLGYTLQVHYFEKISRPFREDRGYMGRYYTMQMDPG